MYAGLLFFPKKSVCVGVGVMGDNKCCPVSSTPWELRSRDDIVPSGTHHPAHRAAFICLFMPLQLIERQIHVTITHIYSSSGYLPHM